MLNMKELLKKKDSISHNFRQMERCEFSGRIRRNEKGVVRCGISCIESRSNSFQLPVVICNSKLARGQVYHRHKDFGFLGILRSTPAKQLVSEV